MCIETLILCTGEWCFRSAQHRFVAASVVHCSVSINNSDPCRLNEGRICIIQQLLSHLGTAKTLREYTLPSPCIKCNVQSKSLSGQSKYSLRATLQGRRSWVISVYLWNIQFQTVLPETSPGADHDGGELKDYLTQEAFSGRGIQWREFWTNPLVS